MVALEKILNQGSVQKEPKWPFNECFSVLQKINIQNLYEFYGKVTLA